MVMKKFYNIYILPWMVWVIKWFILWYGFILCWVVPESYRNSRSRVLEKHRFRIYLKRKVLKNKKISQKRFYSKGNVLFGGGKKVKDSAIATYDTVRFFYNKMQEFVNPLNKKSTNHPTTIQCVYNNNQEPQVMVSNYTTSSHNAVKVAEKGELHETKEVYIHNEFSLISLKEYGAKIDVLNQLKFAKNMDSFNKKLNDNKKIQVNVHKFINERASESKVVIHETDDLVCTIQELVDKSDISIDMKGNYDGKVND